jgi:hypothetical protein
MAIAANAHTRIDRAEAAVLSVVNALDTPASARVVTQEVQKQGYDKSSIVSAIWFLLDRDAIHLTLDLKLAPVAPA